jgi:signal transduction histidine kinase
MPPIRIKHSRRVQAAPLRGRQRWRDEKAKLIERNKELTCLYEIAKIAADSRLSLPEVLRRVADILPPAFQYPHMACARICLNDGCLTTDGFDASTVSLRQPLMIHGREKGWIEVAYGCKAGRAPVGFLPEERELLETIARQAALMIEKKIADQNKAELESQLRHADRLAKVGQLTAGVAHELNEPLAGILGFAQLARKKTDQPTLVADYLDRMIHSCLHAREVIRKLMLFSKQMPNRKSRIDLNRLVEEGLAFIEPRFAKTRIRFERRLCPNLPLIEADASQITQVLVNLVINAIQAMPEGGTLMLTTAYRGDQIALSVEDSGTGIDSAVIDQIFLPFFTTKDVDEGTGLGLSVVHGIVTAHGGKIDVRSRPGAGSCFTVTLPVEIGKNENDPQNATV